MNEIEKLPFQMNMVEVYERLSRGECPINISIDKYIKFKKWIEYKIKENDYECIKYNSHINSVTCALCISVNDDCSQCPLTKIKMQCNIEKLPLSPWQLVLYGTLYINETEERQKELYSAIDNMIETLEMCKEVE